MGDVPDPRRGWKRILLVQAAVLLVGLALLEFGFRIYLRMSGAPYDAEATRSDIELARSQAADLTPRIANDEQPAPRADRRQQPMLHPFLGFIIESKPDQWRVEMARVGVPEYENDYEILIVGGSVADMFGRMGSQRMVERLREDPLFANRRIYVYEYGLGGYKQPQMLNMVQFMLTLGFTPECVIDIDGFNEVALSRDNAARGTSPLFPSSIHWDNLTLGTAPDRELVLLAARGIETQASITSLADRALGLGLQHSAIAGRMLLNRIQALSQEAHSDFEEYSREMLARSADLVRRGSPFPDDPRGIVEMGVKSWEEGSRSLRALCEARGIHYLHCLQPTLHDEGSKPLTPKEIANGRASETWIEGVRIGYPLLRESGERLASEGENFIDASLVFADVKHKLYFDNCHFGEEGNWILGEFIARGLLDSLATPK